MKRVLFSAALLGAAVLVGCWDTKTNPRYCTDSTTCVKFGYAYCNTALHECEVGDGGVATDGGTDGSVACTPETQVTDCTTATLPICKATTHTCEKCGGNADCASLVGKVCATSGACVGCVGQGDCTGGQVCEPTSNTCKPCTSNAQCDSGEGICDSGACVPTAQIAFVDNAHCASPPTGASTAPYCQVNDALAASKSFLRVKGSTTTYNAISIPSGVNASVVIVGPGKAAAVLGTGTGAQFETNGSPALSLSPSGGFSSLVRVDGLELLGSIASGSKAGVFCAGGGGTASLMVTDSYIHDSGAEGVSATSCTLTLQRNLITATKGGITLGSGTTYIVENNFIVAGATIAAAPVRLDPLATGTFRFNTVVDNNATGGAVGGIDCGSSGSKVIESCIVFNNTKVAGSQYTPTCTVTNNVTGVDAKNLNPGIPSLTADYHLAATDTACIDKATTGPAVDIDNDTRPKGAGYDIGADEAK